MKNGWNIVRVTKELFGLGGFEGYFYYYHDDEYNELYNKFFCTIIQINFRERICLLDSLECVGYGDIIDNINIL